ncbi:3-hydroxy-3-methylglutaryl-CoA reductase [Desulfurococcus mucosus]|uniref:3-hydroxy-3-methylglutaryl-coenzyme A reductase n=1 Tax=Desulfurococcus mucosus (strain ATCC 35584 / DSM 2162 / JCM 9187 / O7/1) TaxID=765177 RepID=E8R9C3_DESM0|nr:3-hydroxy-3-methylglutaryl-CoA reductase [Desulfurococcus mucosus]ADV65099.1 3-hydroxy-3-methylglutaryl-coenzyme A reductase [Desulfurococcus mucosus DSM 2162]
MTHNIGFLLEEVRRSGNPFKRLDELEYNENVKALIRRLYIQEKTGLSLSAIGSTILDFTEGDHYRGYNVVGALQVPLGIVGVIQLSINNKSRESYLLAPLTGREWFNMVMDAASTLSESAISVSVDRRGGLCKATIHATFKSHVASKLTGGFHSLYRNTLFLASKTSYMVLIYYMLGLNPDLSSIPLAPVEHSVKDARIEYGSLFTAPRQLLANIVVSEVKGLVGMVDDVSECAIPLIYSFLPDLGSLLRAGEP